MSTATKQQKRGSKNAQTRLALRAALLMLMCVVVAQAQSGRNAGRQPPAGTPTEDSTPPRPVASPTKRTPPEVTFIVTKYVQSTTVTVETTTAFNSFVERLKQSPAVEVISVPADVTRKEAIDRAKHNEQNAYVVWLRIEVDTADTELATAGAPINPGCLNINYTVFSPQTAKVKAQGKVYQRGYAPNSCVAKMGSPIPPREPMHLPNEYRIRIAGSDAANRVLKAFDLELP